MGLNREFIEDRFNYAWVSTPVYADFHNGVWNPEEVDVEDVVASSTLENRVLVSVASSWDVTNRKLDFTAGVNWLNDLGNTLVFNRITLWKSQQGNLGSGVSTGGTITLDTAAASAPSVSARAFVVQGLTVTEVAISGSPTTTVIDVTPSPPDGVVDKLVIAEGIFIGSTRTGFDVSVAANDTVDVTISGQNINA